VPYHFWIPTDTKEWVHAKLTEKGDMIIYDYDVEVDIALEALGMEPTPVLEAILLWKDDPFGLLCGRKDLVPFQYSGLAAWSWAKLAIRKNHSKSEWLSQPDHHEIIEDALNVALLALTELTEIEWHYKDLIQARKEVTGIIPRTLSFGYREHLVIGERPKAALHAVKLLLNGIIAFLDEDTRTASINSFANARFSSLNAINENYPKIDTADESLYRKLIEISVGMMGKFQEETGRLDQFESP
jgi:hypothetical protein